MNPDSDEGHEIFFEIKEGVGLKPGDFSVSFAVFLALKGGAITLKRETIGPKGRGNNP